MPVQFRCPCGIILGAPDEGKGRGGECPACGKIIVVPDNALEVDEAELRAPPKMAPAAPPPEPAPATEPALELALEPAPAPQMAMPARAPTQPRPATPMPRRSVTPVPRAPSATPLPKRSVTPVPRAPAPVPARAAGGGLQLAAAAEPPLETVDDDDILPDDALELVDEAQEAVAVPQSLNALDGLGMAQGGPPGGARDGQAPGRGTRRGTGRTSRRAGAGMAGQPRKCPECNAENEPGARECENCGAPLRGAPRKKGGGFKKFVIFLLLLAILGAGTVAAVGHFAPDKLPPEVLDILKSIGIVKD